MINYNLHTLLLFSHINTIIVTAPTTKGTKKDKGKERQYSGLSQHASSMLSGGGSSSSMMTPSASSDDGVSTPSAMMSQGPMMFGEIYKRLKPSLILLLQHRDEESQLVVLKILLILLPSLSYEDILYFLDPLLSTFPTHPSDMLRATYYDIVIWLYENCEELNGSELLREYLLKGGHTL